jgi:hypothetical protein
MTYDLKKLFPFRELAKQIPARRAGRPVHFSCLHRWSQNGCRGVKLQYVQVGATRCASLEMLEEFFEQLKKQQESGRLSITTPEPIRLPAHRRDAIDAAMRKLQAAGV